MQNNEPVVRKPGKSPIKATAEMVLTVRQLSSDGCHRLPLPRKARQVRRQRSLPFQPAGGLPTTRTPLKVKPRVVPGPGPPRTRTSRRNGTPRLPLRLNPDASNLLLRLLACLRSLRTRPQALWLARLFRRHHGSTRPSLHRLMTKPHRSHRSHRTHRYIHRFVLAHGPSSMHHQPQLLTRLR